ncbi:MAG TPA: transporter substrate-binding domain-containing protein [Acholeplasmataceae bacterium]|nr:transporter substrate-binding domain-containing protein [Acholeplasmataceae bacterium]HQC30620.1 transporter substrate-binding domain-containing protein [Acholeplasmataceae bacterium]
MRKLFLFLLVVLSATTLVACGGQQPYDFDKEDTIIIGMEADYAPYNWSTSVSTDFTHPIHGRNDYADGYDVQIAKLIAAGLGKKLVIKAIGWDGLPPAVQSGQIHLLLAGMTPTPERSKTLLFSNEYYRAEPVIVLRKDSSFNGKNKTLNDFNGAKAVAQLGTIYEGLVEQLPGAVAQTSLEDYTALLLAVKNKTTDIVIAELPVAESMVRFNEELTYIRFAAGEGFNIDTQLVIVSIGMTLNNTELKRRVDEILAGISQAERERMMNAAIERQG